MPDFGRPDYTANISAPFIPDDEPVFLIRAADSLGIALILAYANQLSGTGEEKLAASVTEHWNRMFNYRRTLKRLPDITDRNYRGEIDTTPYSQRMKQKS